MKLQLYLVLLCMVMLLVYRMTDDQYQQAKGDRTKKVGVVDSEFIVHQGVQTLGGPSAGKNQNLKGIRCPPPRSKQVHRKDVFQSRGREISDARIEVRRQARLELLNFQERWNKATREGEGWVDRFRRIQKQNL